MSLAKFLANSLVAVLPPTRCYGLKAGLLRSAGIEIGTNVKIVSSVRIWGELSLKIGQETFIGHEVLITGGKSSVQIGEFVDIGPRVTIVTGTHAIDMDGNRSAGLGEARDIHIENGVWIGAGCTIIGGVRIGQHAVVAAGSTVVNDIPEYTVAAGVPCRPRKRWNRATKEWTVLNVGVSKCQ